MTVGDGTGEEGVAVVARWPGASIPSSLFRRVSGAHIGRLLPRLLRSFARISGPSSLVSLHPLTSAALSPLMFARHFACMGCWQCFGRGVSIVCTVIILSALNPLVAVTHSSESALMTSILCRLYFSLVSLEHSLRVSAEILCRGSELVRAALDMAFPGIFP